MWPEAEIHTEGYSSHTIMRTDLLLLLPLFIQLCFSTFIFFSSLLLLLFFSLSLIFLPQLFSLLWYSITYLFFESYSLCISCHILHVYRYSCTLFPSNTLQSSYRVRRIRIENNANALMKTIFIYRRNFRGIMFRLSCQWE